MQVIPWMLLYPVKQNVLTLRKRQWILLKNCYKNSYWMPFMSCHLISNLKLWLHDYVRCWYSLASSYVVWTLQTLNAVTVFHASYTVNPLDDIDGMR